MEYRDSHLFVEMIKITIALLFIRTKQKVVFEKFHDSSQTQTCKNTLCLHNQGLGQNQFTQEKHGNCQQIF